MDMGTRWTLVAFLVGFCAAYGLWGGREGPARVSRQPSLAPEERNNIGAEDPALVPRQTPGAISALRLKPIQVEFGEVPLGERRTATVQLTNSGSTPVTVLEIQPSCGCVHGRLEQTRIEPGQSAPLEVGFHAEQGKRAGTLTLTLASDEAGHPRLVLPVGGKTREEFKTDPALLRFGRVEKNATKTLSATITRADGKPFKIERITSQNKDVTATWASLEGDSGYALSITAKGARAGTYTDAAVIFVDHPTVKVVSLPMLVEVAPAIVCTPMNVRADQNADKTVAPFDVTVKRQSAGRLEIESVKDGAEIPVTFTTERVDDATVRLKLQLNGPYTPRVPFGQFLIKTNADDEAVPLPYRVNMPVPGIAPKPSASGKKP